MAICNSCGGVIGHDCFNPQECQLITDQLNQQPIIHAEAWKQLIQEAKKVSNAVFKLSEVAKKLKFPKLK